MYLDFKITAWERVYIPEEIQEEVIQKLKSGEIRTKVDALNHFKKEGAVFDDTIGIETMCLEENRGHSTIEFIGEFNDIPLFKNGK